MNRVDEKVAMVTGGGRGVGKATCELLAQAGAKIVVTDICIETAEETAKSIRESGTDAIALEHNVANEADWVRVVGATLKHFKKLDILVNNAGIAIRSGYIDKTPFEDWRRMINVNLDGVFLGVRAAINAMKESGNAGSIINISSVCGIMAGEANAHYSAAKGGVRLLSKAAALDCGRKGFNIRINSICPGGVNTPMSKDQGLERFEERQRRHPIGRGAEAIDIAKGVLFLASDDASFITGIDLVIDGGVSAGFISGHYPSDKDWFGYPRGGEA